MWFTAPGLLPEYRSGLGYSKAPISLNTEVSCLLHSVTTNWSHRLNRGAAKLIRKVKAVAIKRLLARTSVGVASLIPLRTRRNATQKSLNATKGKVAGIQAKVDSAERDIGNAEIALELSVTNEADAENRVAQAASDRDEIAGKSDLKRAEKLSIRNRNVIRKTEKKLSKQSAKLSTAKSKQAQQVSALERIDTQLAAAKAAGPTRVSRAATATRETVSKGRKKASSLTGTGGPTRKQTPAARVKITGPGPVVRKFGLKKGDTFVIGKGEVIRPAPKKFRTRRRSKFN